MPTSTFVSESVFLDEGDGTQKSCNSVKVNFTADTTILSLFATNQSDEGHWEDVTVNIKHNFTLTGNRLRVKVTGENGSTMTKLTAKYTVI